MTETQTMGRGILRVAVVLIQPWNNYCYFYISSAMMRTSDYLEMGASSVRGNKINTEFSCSVVGHMDTGCIVWDTTNEWEWFLYAPLSTRGPNV